MTRDRSFIPGLLAAGLTFLVAGDLSAQIRDELAAVAVLAPDVEAPQLADERRVPVILPAADDQRHSQVRSTRQADHCVEYLPGQFTGRRQDQAVGMARRPAPKLHYNIAVCHERLIGEAETANYIHLDDMLACITQDDVVKRRVFDPEHRAFVPDS